MEPAGALEDVYVLVEYEFEYVAKDGTLISIKPNERYVLLRRTNDHWWHVKKSKDARPFYIPAKYVKELPPVTRPTSVFELPPETPGQLVSRDTLETIVLQPARAGQDQPLAYEYKFLSAAQQKEQHKMDTNKPDTDLGAGSVWSGSGTLGPACKDTSFEGETLTQVVGEGKDSPPVLSSFHNPHCAKRSSHSPALHIPPIEHMRPTQSLDDLARVTPNPRLRVSHTGSRRAGTTAGPLLSPQPLSKSQSENIYESIKDLERQEKAGTRAGSSRPAQAWQEEENPTPVYVNIQELRQQSAATDPSPPQHCPSSVLEDWETHTDTGSGHLFYYNSVTGETTWDSPFACPEDGVSPAPSPSPSLAPSPAAAEWGQYVDDASGQVFFYNSVTGETSWELPPAVDEPSAQEMQPAIAQYRPMDQRPPTPETDYPDLSPEELDGYPEEDYSPVGSYKQSTYPYLLPGRSPRHSAELSPSPGWCSQDNPEGQAFYPDYYASDTVSVPEGHRRASSGSSQDSSPFASWHNYMPAILIQKEEKFKSLDKAGVLYRTKTADKGKRLRKNWSSSWTVLEGGILTFFKESKHLSSSSLKHPAMLTTPEHTVDLRGAAVSWAPKEKSSKKNVLELKTRDGSEFLIQHDSEPIVATWQKAIADSIGKLSTDFPTHDENANVGDFGAKERLRNNKDEDKKNPASGPAASSLGSESDTSKVRNRLRKLLQKRPPLQFLRERGYIKDQVFGCSLQALCEREHGTVPGFVQQCIQTVEHRGLDIDGLYRISGNLATIQKLRYKVDHDEHLDLDDGRWEDVHVITGALKLFFRELPEPLFPFSYFDKFITAIKIHDQAKRSKCIRDLVCSLPEANCDTMKALFQHLCRVIDYKEQNRMSVQSVAIVFGPTLLRPETEEVNMAMHMVFQNQIVEHILNQYSYIFPDS
ncbi:C-type lectin domain family 12 member B-like [Platysternon megacephalum]|uniref:C-type lectin domain family 12 member B-like n=1 Tax=Platysternon megacephalum TaxID=55544 RepID=A0A4D9DM30_9SAUR|nr:C-type lectin domain family 12 member B-like [Platysternon megacephalum]